MKLVETTNQFLDTQIISLYVYVWDCMLNGVVINMYISVVLVWKKWLLLVIAVVCLVSQMFSLVIV